MIRTRGNKAKKDKGSIVADAKNLLCVLHPAIQNMPKIDRIEGAPSEMKRACYDLIRHFTVAMECPEVRLTYIHKMFADFGAILASFELCIQFGLFTDGDKLRRCLTYLPEHSIKSRLNQKYHLKLKKK